MDKFPGDDEAREKPRKPTRKRQPRQPDDLKLAHEDYVVKIESRETASEIEARLRNESTKLAHELKKDEKTFQIVAAMLVLITLGCLFIVLSNRYSPSIQGSAFALISAIISGVVVYLKAKPEKS